MDDQIAIKVESLSKVYKLYDSKYDFLKELFNPFRKEYHKKFYALNDVSFELKRGEVLGIIGKNGSGKSTLLKILAGVVTPTAGKYSCKGKVTALLELGGGFDKNLTGLQNIKFLLSLQGYKQKEIEELVEGIIEFADIGDYIHQPIKMYSSGMYVRLAFSMSIAIDPQILVVDEALAVGDIRFQQKCYRKIQNFKDAGKTIIMCTHSLDIVKKFCTQTIWLHNGKIMENGIPNYITDHYKAFMHSPDVIEKSITKIDDEFGNSEDQLKPGNKFSFDKEIIWQNVADCESFGTREAEIQFVSIINSSTNQSITDLKGGEYVTVLIKIEQKYFIQKPAIHLLLNGRFSSTVFRLNSNIYEKSFSFINTKHIVVEIKFTFPVLSNGQYTFSLGLIAFNNKERDYIHWVHDAMIVSVENPDDKFNMGTQIVIEEASFKTKEIK